MEFNSIQHRFLGIAVFIGMLTCNGCGPTAVSPTPAASKSAAVDAAPADEAATGARVKHRSGDGPVTATLRLANGTAAPGDEIDLAVEFKIAPTWEIHTLDAQPSIAATRLDLSLPPGIAASGEWKAPAAARSLAPDGHPVYIGNVVFVRTLRVQTTSPSGIFEIGCDAAFQACSGGQCLRPNVVELKATLVIKAL